MYNPLSKEIIVYKTKSGKVPLDDWLGRLDKVMVSRIQSRFKRLCQGNYGDYKHVGQGVLELRYHFGSGYRVYFAEENDKIVILLCGGDKSAQQSKDIDKAQHYWQDYKQRRNSKE